MGAEIFVIRIANISPSILANSSKNCFARDTHAHMQQNR